MVIGSIIVENGIIWIASNYVMPQHSRARHALVDLSRSSGQMPVGANDTQVDIVDGRRAVRANVRMRYVIIAREEKREKDGG